MGVTWTFWDLIVVSFFTYESMEPIMPQEIEDPLEEALEVIPFTYAISSYGADYPVDALVRRIQSGDILVPNFDNEDQLQDDLDAFQREYVWPRPKADRFIESLLLGLPVPGIFMVKEDNGRLLVLDGYQRLNTLKSFYAKIIHGKEYRLTGIQDRFCGKTYDDLDVEDRRRIDDSILHATVVRQEQPTEDWSSIYAIFERLNTGGVSLQAQEVRMALYHGEFAKVLRKNNTNDNWRALVGPVSRRLKDVELILRFYALLYYHDQYESPMKDFLNRYMATNRDLGRNSEHQLNDIFLKTVEIIHEEVGNHALRPERAVNAAFADAFMVGVATAIQRGADLSGQKLCEAREQLLADEDFVSAITAATAQKAKVTSRIAKAINCICA